MEKMKIESDEERLILRDVSGELVAVASKRYPKKRFARIRIICKMNEWDEIFSIIKTYLEN